MQSAFVSYFREDSNSVKVVCDALEKSGIPYWIDVDRLEAGENWNREIEKKIQNAAAFVLCISRHFYERPDSYVHRELEIARNVLAGKHPSELWYFPLQLDPAEIPNQSIADGRYLSDYQVTIAYPDLLAGADQLAARLGKYFADPGRNNATLMFVSQSRYSGYLRINEKYPSPKRMDSRTQVVVPPGNHVVDVVDHDPVDNGDYNHLERNYNSTKLNISVAPGDVLVVAIRDPWTRGSLWWKQRECKDTWVVELVSHFKK